MSVGCGCKDCKRIREHVAPLGSLLPFRILEAAAGKPLRIGGVAMTGETEESVFCALGLPCPIPEQREIVDGKPLWKA